MNFINENKSPKAVDVISRADYSSDNDYIEACVKYEIEHHSPEYERAVKKVESELSEKRAKEQKEKNENEYKELRKTVKLLPSEESRISAEARRKAEADLLRNKIQEHQFSGACENYAKMLREQALDSKASSILMSRLIRS